LNDLIALRQVASIHRNIKQYDAAKADELKIISLDGKDAEANYTIGVIDWTQAYKNATTILGAAGITDDGLGNVKKSKDVCAKLAEVNTPLVTEAQTYLQKAVDINPNYDDAMQYLNLNYRRKADLAQADAWVVKATGARKANEAAKEKAHSGGVSMN